MSVIVAFQSHTSIYVFTSVHGLNGRLKTFCPTGRTGQNKLFKSAILFKIPFHTEESIYSELVWEYFVFTLLSAVYIILGLARNYLVSY